MLRRQAGLRGDARRIGRHPGGDSPKRKSGRERHQEGEDHALADLGLREQIKHGETSKRLLLPAESRAAALAFGRGGATLVHALPFVGFRDRSPDPQRQQRRRNAEQEHDAPGIGTDRADEEPRQRGQEETDAEAALHQPDTLAAVLVGPELGNDRGAGHPFGADRKPHEKPQYREGQPVPGKRAEPGQDRVGEDRQNHRALAPDIVGNHAPDHAADRPAEQGERDHRAGIDRDLSVARRIEELAQGDADRDDQRIGFVTVEDPAQIGCDQRLPLGTAKGAIPGL